VRYIIFEVKRLRYAIDGSVTISEKRRFDVVIVGAGLAGLYTALNIDARLSCCILAKEEIDLSNSWFAQGGIAAAVSEDDAPVFHVEDTLAAGAGLCDRAAVEVLCAEGPRDIVNLLSRGVPFDLDDAGELSITREGGHHKNRVLHAGGDATGRETVKALAHLIAARGNITLREHTCFHDVLLSDNGAVSGAVVSAGGKFMLLETPNVVVATGGIGQVYVSSTNPSVATGDGIAAAMRCGAIVSNLEFIQFHPTGLWSEVREARDFLISEAVRGEGGLLKNCRGERFMLGAHELNELAPRDIVARAIVRELTRTGESHVFVDITAKSEAYLKRRFPTIYGECLARGIHIAEDWIPVAPVHHYLMGGVKSDLYARTNIPGLYVCGEAACSGVHGANRLASNSMLECLVFGRRAAEDVNSRTAPRVDATLPALPRRPEATPEHFIMRGEIQELMSQYGYVIRTARGMESALARVRAIREGLECVASPAIGYLETLNVAAVAEAILAAALARPVSIGSHCVEPE
jgi:L-aspartate oxidase